VLATAIHASALGFIDGAISDNRAGTALGINHAVSRVAGLIAVAARGGLADMVYTGAGGTGSCGAFSDTPDHAAAMTAAFVQIGWGTFALSGLSAGVAWVFIPGRAQSSARSAAR
jgi:hypothetical protein